MDSHDNHRTKSTIHKICMDPEQEVVRALVDYYRRVKSDTMDEIQSIEVSIEMNMDDIRRAEMTPGVRQFQEIMERGECSLRSSLKEKRNKVTPPNVLFPYPTIFATIIFTTTTLAQFFFYAHTCRNFIA